METALQLAVWGAAVLLRVGVGLLGYSGAGTPPMFGDFEAQRHWLEITTNLPVGDWYRQTKDNDLQYWGLDYPPLTAYVSWIFGMISKNVFPPLVELHSSRGHESLEGKSIMRWSVILCDLLVYFPAVYYMLRRTDVIQQHLGSGLNERRFILALLQFAILVTPALILVDHGHFQYNATCVGLTLLAASCIVNGKYVAGSIFFCLSLNFKQMALYYAPVFFFALLKTCYSPTSLMTAFIRLAKIGISVILTFAVLWGPFCVLAAESETCIGSLQQVLLRLFPFNRGLFEDKVANLWYCLSVVTDVRTKFPVHQLAHFSLVLTLALIFPICINLLAKQATGQRLTLALITCSLSFFLASFQVHEKSLLLPLVPAMLLLYREPVLICWFQVLGCFTMFPLLIRDGHRSTYWLLIMGFLCLAAVLMSARQTSVQVTGLHPVIRTSAPPVILGKTSSNSSISSIGSHSTSSSPRHGGPSNANSPSKKNYGSNDHRKEIILVSDETLVPQSSAVSGALLERHSDDDGFPLLNTELKWLTVVLSSTGTQMQTAFIRYLMKVLTGMIVLHLLEGLVPPPARYPDLYPALFSLYGAGNLVLLYIIFVSWLWVLADNGKMKEKAI
jgi:alpha-1,3-glucosyltransferase